MSIAISAFGIQLKIGDGGSPTENFTTVAEVKNSGGPTLEAEQIDVTNHQSPGQWREFIPGALNAGELTLDLNFVPTNDTQDATAGLIADLKNRVKRNFRLVFPDSGSTTWSFAAFVRNFEVSAPHDDALTASCTLKITGQPTLV